MYITKSLENLFGDDNFLFQHNYALTHGAKRSEKFVKERNIATLEWACNSPDLHTIEFVWQRMKAEVRKAEITNNE